jgi:uncharacterized membrane protein
MEDRTFTIIAASVIVLMAAVSVWALAALPRDALVPIHFALDGRADAWARPAVGLSLLPATALAVLAVFATLAHGARGGLARSGTAHRTVMLAVIGLLGAAHGVIIAVAFGREVGVTHLMVILTGLLLIVVGNVMGKVRPNRWLGIRTPWTLADARVWDRTHRFAARIFVVAGAALVVASMALPAGNVLAVILLATIALVVIAPCAKSYLLWRDRQNI